VREKERKIEKKLIKEIIDCRKLLTERFSVYTSNTISRLIEAEISLALLYKEVNREFSIGEN